MKDCASRIGSAMMATSWCGEAAAARLKMLINRFRQKEASGMTPAQALRLTVEFSRIGVGPQRTMRDDREA